MSNKFGKFLLAATALGTAAVAAYHFLQKKDSALDTQEDGDEDYDDFSDSLDEETGAPSRSYVSLDPESVTKDASVEEATSNADDGSTVDEVIDATDDDVMETNDADCLDDEVADVDVSDDDIMETNDTDASDDDVAEAADVDCSDDAAEAANVDVSDDDIMETNDTDASDDETVLSDDITSIDEVVEPTNDATFAEEVPEADANQMPTTETETLKDTDDFFVEETIVEVSVPIEKDETFFTTKSNIVSEEITTSNAVAEETEKIPLAPDKEAEDFDEEAIALSRAINALVEEISDSDIEAELEDDDFFIEETITITTPVEDTAVSAAETDEPVTVENQAAPTPEATTTSQAPTVSIMEEDFVEETESDSFSPLSAQISVEETVEEFFNDEEEEE